MPNLPTVTVTQAQADRCLAAWGSAESYKAWLVDQVRRFVIDHEKRALKAAKADEVRAGLDSIEASDPMAGV